MNHSIERWIGLMSAAQLPVLGRTLSQLAALRENEGSIRPRDISQLVLHDPFMALRVLRFLKEHRRARTLAEITTVEHAIMMLGVSPFFRTFAGLRAVDADLASDKAALDGLMAVASRARHAALHARQWAQIRHDIESDEVVIATLLHDLAEMLLWYFAPAQAGEIQARMELEPQARSMEVQRAVLGFGLNELQLELAAAWGLPSLITSLMDDYRADRPRARNVLLAVNLARHTAKGWEDAALADDIDAVRRLLNRPLLEVRQRIFHTALEAVHDHEWYGAGAPAMWLPPFPLDTDAGESVAGPQQSTAVLSRVKRMLAAGDRDDMLNWAASGAPNASGPSPGVPALVALALHGLFKGLGLARQTYCSVDQAGTTARASYLGGVRESGGLMRLTLPLGMANPLTRKFADEGVLWWRGAADLLPLTDLPREWRVAAGNGGFFAALIRTAEGRGAVVYADGNGVASALNEEKFSRFREVCELLSTRLAGPAQHTST